MYAIELPALDGRLPLGFLAALGVLRLLADEARADVRLSFSDVTGCAVLHGDYRGSDEIARELQRVMESIPPDGVLPGVPADFPLSKSGAAGSDPMRVLRTDFAKLTAQVAERGEEASRWLSVLVTDLAADNNGRVALTPFAAPSGQQTVRSFFEKPLSAVRGEPNRLAEALQSWRRVDGNTGEYLDHRVLRSAADHPMGRSLEVGVPGATWLAIMALPLLRLGGDGARWFATLWHRVPGRRQQVMVWPLWGQPLEVDAVRVLIEHPVLRPQLTDGTLTLQAARCRALGVFQAAAAERQQVRGRNFAGVLAPTPIRLAEADRARGPG